LAKQAGDKDFAAAFVFRTDLAKLDSMGVSIAIGGFKLLLRY